MKALTRMEKVAIAFARESFYSGDLKPVTRLRKRLRQSIGSDLIGVCLYEYSLAI